jgi:hypothetical protein
MAACLSLGRPISNQHNGAFPLSEVLPAARLSPWAVEDGNFVIFLF